MLIIFISLYFVFNKIIILFYIYVLHLVVVKNEDILNYDASHFKLPRSALKIASFEFANLQYSHG